MKMSNQIRTLSPYAGTGTGTTINQSKNFKNIQLTVRFVYYILNVYIPKIILGSPE